MKNYKVIWTKSAKKDLEEIIDYISLDSIEKAFEQFKKIKEKAKKLSTFPGQGRIIPELSRQNIIKYRELIVSPWRIMYKIEGNIVYVMAVIDGRRNIEDILLKRQFRWLEKILKKMNILKSSRHSKIAGNFGENLFLYLLSKRGYEVALIDHTGIDLLAFDKNKKRRIGISIKTRTRIPGTENDGIYIKISEIEKIRNACHYFGCEPYLGIVIDRVNTIDAVLAPMEEFIKINGIGKRFFNIKVTKKYMEQYKTVKNSLLFRFTYQELNSDNK